MSPLETEVKGHPLGFSALTMSRFSAIYAMKISEECGWTAAPHAPGLLLPAVVTGMGCAFPLTRGRETKVIGEFSRWERKEAAPPLKMQHGNLHVEILSSQFLIENTPFRQQAETCTGQHNTPV